MTVPEEIEQLRERMGMTHDEVKAYIKRLYYHLFDVAEFKLEREP